MTTGTTATRMTTRAEDAPAVREYPSAQCPACLRTTELHAESVRLGAEVLCRECSAILRIESTNPLILVEIEEEDLLD